MDERNEINQTSPGEVLTDRGIRSLIRYGSPVCGMMYIDMLNHNFYPIPRVSFHADDASMRSFVSSKLFLRQRRADSFRS